MWLKGFFWSLVLIVFLQAERSQAEPWPCPDFGPCRFQMVVGQCKAFLFFEYTKSFQVRGKDQVSFWQTDNPKPCALTFRTGRIKERYTFEKYYCQEILELFQQAALVQEAHEAPGSSDFFECSDAENAGILAFTFPDPLVHDGLWRPIRRQIAAIPNLDKCAVNASDHSLVCADVNDTARDWLKEIMARVKWNVVGQPLFKNRPLRKLNLAPGDRMRSDQ